jgi:hypothetical protein
MDEVYAAFIKEGGATVGGRKQLVVQLLQGMAMLGVQGNVKVVHRLAMVANEEHYEAHSVPMLDLPVGSGMALSLYHQRGWWMR